MIQGRTPIITWQGDKRRVKLLMVALQDVLTAWNRDKYSGQVDSETNLVWLAAAKLLREARETPKLCEWKKDRDGIYETSCGNSFDFFDGGPIENHYQVLPILRAFLWGLQKMSGRKHESPMMVPFILCVLVGGNILAR